MNLTYNMKIAFSVLTKQPHILNREFFFPVFELKPNHKYEYFLVWSPVRFCSYFILSVPENLLKQKEEKKNSRTRSHNE